MGLLLLVLGCQLQLSPNRLFREFSRTHDWHSLPPAISLLQRPSILILPIARPTSTSPNKSSPKYCISISKDAFLGLLFLVLGCQLQLSPNRLIRVFSRIHDWHSLPPAISLLQRPSILILPIARPTSTSPNKSSPKYCISISKDASLGLLFLVLGCQLQLSPNRLIWVFNRIHDWHSLPPAISLLQRPSI